MPQWCTRLRPLSATLRQVPDGSPSAQGCWTRPFSVPWPRLGGRNSALRGRWETPIECLSTTAETREVSLELPTLLVRLRYHLRCTTGSSHSPGVARGGVSAGHGRGNIRRNRTGPAGHVMPRACIGTADGPLMSVYVYGEALSLPHGRRGLCASSLSAEIQDPSGCPAAAVAVQRPHLQSAQA